MNDSVVAVLEDMFSDGDPLERAKAAEAVIGYCHAQQLRAFHQVFVESELGADPYGVVVDPTPPDSACAMLWSPGAASAILEAVGGDASVVRLVDRHDVLATTLERLQVDRVVVVPAEDEPELTLDLIRTVKSLGARVSVLPHVLEVVGSAVAYDDVYGMPVLGVRRFGLTRSSQILKRIMDLVVGGILFLVFSPVMAVAALLIKLDSPGPVLFRQDRMGREGRRFRMLKFRSMVDGADALRAELMDDNETDGLFKIAEDPRITRVGRVLRRTSLDELPQLFNVLWGDMSMVGPRPLVLDEDALISGLDRRRLTLTPGITGPWQILGSGQVPLSEMVQIDYLYAANWSAWGDIKILMRTVIYVLRGRGL